MSLIIPADSADSSVDSVSEDAEANILQGADPVDIYPESAEEPAGGAAPVVALDTGDSVEVAVLC